MKRKNKRLTAGLVIIGLLTSSLLSLKDINIYRAATSYSNAKEFYESTASKGQKYHAEMTNGTIYYATCAKLASSSSNLKYVTLGFDVKLSGNGESVSFAVERGEDYMVEIDSEESGGYEYILYAIDTGAIEELAKLTDEEDAEEVFEDSEIIVTMNAIMTTKSGSNKNGSIEEDGEGGVSESGTIYHLKNSGDLDDIMDVFDGHDFESYYNITENMKNPKLSIRYAVDGRDPGASSTDAKVDSDYHLRDVASGDTTVYSVLHEGSEPYTDSARIFEEMELLDPEDIDLRRKGYHLEEGCEWETKSGREFDANSSYMPKTLSSKAGYGNHNMYLYANWQPNTYTIQYDNNGGIGFLPDSIHSYDRPKELRNNVFINFGYSLVPGEEWNTEPDGSGTSYAAGEEVENLSHEDDDVITLYANWQPGIFTIRTDKDGGSGGTDRFYEEYDEDWYLDSSLTQETESILVPQKTGYTFEGYSKYFYGIGRLIVDKLGKIQVDPDYYERDATIYANYIPKEYTITFDKQGGSGGTDSVNVVYDQLLPIANSPVKSGYSFKGYYTQTNGQGTCYYTEFMASELRYQVDGNLTLYAFWKDETPPTTELTVSAGDWTRNPIDILGKATDLGTGLSKIELYYDGTKVSEQTNLNGARTASIPWVHTTEAVFQYKVVAYDMEGNISEAYSVVKYDVTAPKGTLNVTNSNKTSFSIAVDATDYKIP